MNRKELENQLIQMIKKVKESEEIDIAVGTNLIDDIGLDSFELINLMLDIEEKFNIEIDFDDFDYDCLENFKLFLDFIEGVLEKNSE